MTRWNFKEGRKCRIPNEKSSRSAEGLYKFFIYFVLILLAVTIIVPVAWVFMASIKQNCRVLRQPVGTACRVLLAELCQRMERG